MSKTYTIGIITFDGVLTSEVIGPAEVFATATRQNGFNARVLLIGVEPQPSIRTEEGLQLVVDATIADDLELDILLVPGGNEMSHLLAHEPLNGFIQKHAASAEWVGSMCAGAFLLGKAGVLDDRQATTWFGGESSLQAQFPAIQVVYDQSVVVDRRRITANGGLVSYQAALVLLGQLSSVDLAKAAYKKLGLKRLSTWEEIEKTLRQMEGVQ